MIDWSTLIGIGGLLVAGLTIWLNFNDRRATYRSHLYERQIQVATDMSEPIFKVTMVGQVGAAFVQSVNEAHALGGGPIDVKWTEIAHFHRDEISNSLEQLGRYVPLGAIILPSPVYEAISNLQRMAVDLYKVLRDIGIDSRASDFNLGVYKYPEASKFLAAQNTVVGLMREHLGISPLSDETLRVLGVKTAIEKTPPAINEKTRPAAKGRLSPSTRRELQQYAQLRKRNTK